MGYVLMYDIIFFARDNYTYQVCNCKNKILEIYDIIYQSGLANCHTSENYNEGGILDKGQKYKQVKKYIEPPFMNSLRLRTFKKYSNANIWYSTPKHKNLC